MLELIEPIKIENELYNLVSATNVDPVAKHDCCNGNGPFPVPVPVP